MVFRTVKLSTFFFAPVGSDTSHPIPPTQKRKAQDFLCFSPFREVVLDFVAPRGWGWFRIGCVGKLVFFEGRGWGVVITSVSLRFF